MQDRTLELRPEGGGGAGQELRAQGGVQAQRSAPAKATGRRGPQSCGREDRSVRPHGRVTGKVVGTEQTERAGPKKATAGARPRPGRPQEEPGDPGVSGVRYGLTLRPFGKSPEQCPASPNPSGNGGPAPAAAALGDSLAGTASATPAWLGLPRPFLVFV